MIDLHVHTNQSDGELSPIEVLRRATKNGVKTLSITDHDTLAAYDFDILPQASKLGLNLIPGVEISTVDELGRKWHILGHFIDPFSPFLREWLESLKQARRTYTKDLILKLRSVGWSVDEEILKLDVISKAHIADAVIGHEDNVAILSEYFGGTTPSRGQFIERMLNKGCPAYVLREKSPSPEEAIGAIRRAGGVSTIAHPIAAVNEQFIKIEEIARYIKTLDLDGVEVYYYYYNKSQGDRKSEMVSDFLQLAKSLGLAATGGSDYHGSGSNIGNYVDIGMPGETLTMPVSELRDLVEARKRRSAQAI